MSKIIGFAREGGREESRTLLMPAQVPQFVEAGFQVRVEQGIGQGLGVPDLAYEEAGAQVLDGHSLWTTTRLVLKFKAPEADLWHYLRPGLSFAAFLHAEGNPELTAEFRKSGMSAYALEFFRTPQGYFPMSVADSEISGRLAVIIGAYHLQKHLGGRGIFLPHVTGATPARVVVIGYGNAGGAAVRTAVSLGAEVVVLGRNRAKMRAFQAGFTGQVRCELNTPETLERELSAADLVIGSIQISTFDTPPMIDEQMLTIMKPGSMIVDVTCGYGAGYLPTFDRQTSFDNPVYERNGVLHCKIDRLPAATPLTTSEAVSALVTPYLVAFGNAVVGDGPADPTSEAGLVVRSGEIIHPEVMRHMAHYEAREQQDHVRTCSALG